MFHSGLNRAPTAGTLQTDAVVYTTVPLQNQQDVARWACRGNLTPVALLPLCCLAELPAVVGSAQCCNQAIWAGIGWCVVGKIRVGRVFGGVRRDRLKSSAALGDRRRIRDEMDPLVP